MHPPIFKISIDFCIFVFVQLPARFTKGRHSNEAVRDNSSIERLPPKVLCILFRIIYQWLKMTCKICRIFVVFVSVVEWVRWSSSGIMIVSSAENDWNNFLCHDIEKLFCHIVDTNRVLEWKVKVVISFGHFPASGLIGSVTFELATAAVDVNLKVLIDSLHYYCDRYYLKLRWYLSSTLNQKCINIIKSWCKLVAHQIDFCSNVIVDSNTLHRVSYWKILGENIWLNFLIS